MTSIKDRIKECLELRNMTQAELCRITGIAKSTMSQYLSGLYEPKLDNLSKIANALNVSLDYLLGTYYDKYLIKNVGFPNDDFYKEMGAGDLFNKDSITTGEYLEYLSNINKRFGYNYFNIVDLTDEEKEEFAKSIIEYIELLSHKYKK